MDAQATKTLVIGLVILIYALALAGRRVTVVHQLLAVAYLLVGFRLGYDTLMYRRLLEEGRIDHYGPIWAALGSLYNATGVWWIVHAVVLSAVTWPLVALARRTSWPTLALAMMVTLPGLGFDFLSLLRQALATALVILFHLAASRRNWLRAAVAATAAYMAHPAAGFAILALMIFHLRRDARRLMLGALACCGFLLAVALSAPDFVEAQLSNIAFLFARYLIADEVIENDSGVKLAMFWALVLATPVLLQALVKPGTVRQGPFLLTILFVSAYAALVTISGSTVRLLWLLLPMVLALPMAALTNHSPPYLINLCRGFVVASSVGAAIYAVQIAPEHYWAGEYPHEVTFDPE